MRRGRQFATSDEILAAVTAEVKDGDVVLAMSNGAFGGIVLKLKAAIEARAAAK